LPVLRSLRWEKSPLASLRAISASLASRLRFLRFINSAILRLVEIRVENASAASEEDVEVRDREVTD